jgi:biopolymer transport protein ExbD
MFRRKEREVPALNTASLPDLIFTVLFFFMIVTHMRQADLKVQYRVPQGTELSRLTHKSTAQYLYIGPPSKELQPTMGKQTLIQLNDRIVSIDELRELLAEQRRLMSDEDQERMVVCIRADRSTDMGLLSDVKRALREANALKISYSAVETDE